jgi:hypothetical protein
MLSELRKRRGHPSVLRWLNAVPESSLFLSVVIIGEVQKGISAVASRDRDFAMHLAD